MARSMRWRWPPRSPSCRSSPACSPATPTHSGSWPCRAGWHLRRGRAQVAVDIVNRIIVRSGNRVPPLTVAALGDYREAVREQLPPYWALFAKGQLRWTLVGVFSGTFAGAAFFLISVLLPKALVDQGLAVSLVFGITSLVYSASIAGKAFTGFLMEIIGR